MDGRRAESELGAGESRRSYYWLVASRLIAPGRVIPFLGAGANMCGRPQGTPWHRGGEFLPSGAELARLPRPASSRYPAEATTPICSRCRSTSTPCSAKAGPLRVPPRSVRRQLPADRAAPAAPPDVARMLRERGQTPLLVLTTNYDDALERAFEEVDEPYQTSSGTRQSRARPAATSCTGAKTRSWPIPRQANETLLRRSTR